MGANEAADVSDRELVSETILGLDRVCGQSRNVRLLDPSLEKYAESRGSASPWTMSLTLMGCVGGAFAVAVPFLDMVEGVAGGTLTGAGDGVDDHYEYGTRDRGKRGELRKEGPVVGEKKNATRRRKEVRYEGRGRVKYSFPRLKAPGGHAAVRCLSRFRRQSVIGDRKLRA